MGLNKYDNPERARKVWRSYAPDFKELGGYDLAEDAIENSKTADELDVRLDLIVTGLRLRLRATTPTASSDIDADGSLSNAKRILEGD